MRLLIKRPGWTAGLASAICLAALALFGTGGAQAGDGVKAMEAWARPSLGKAPNSAAYVTIMNHSGSADRLVAAKADVSERVELHQHIMEGNVAKMRPVEGGIEVPANGKVELKPGGLHVMLIGLSGKLSEGDSFPMTLVFESGAEQTIEVSVRKISGTAKSGHGHGGHGSGTGHSSKPAATD